MPQPYRVPCGAILNSVAEFHRCQRIPADGYRYCWQHGGPTKREAAERDAAIEAKQQTSAKGKAEP